jgi:hypothetical protein
MTIIKGTLNQFLHAYALVSSRAFVVDDYHGLSLVPIADLFNHVELNQVQFEVDSHWVCSTCGSSSQCSHDDDGIVKMNDDDKEEEEDYCVLSTIVDIEAGDEVFNSYGNGLSNTHLLQHYGFLLEANSFDRISFPLSHLSAVLPTASASIIGEGLLLDLVEFEELIDDNEEEREFYIDSDAKLSQSLLRYIITHHTNTNGENSDQRGIVLREAVVNFCHQEVQNGHQPQLSGAEILALLDDDESVRYFLLSSGVNSTHAVHQWQWQWPSDKRRSGEISDGIYGTTKDVT